MSYFDEIQRMVTLARDLADSPSMRVLQDIERYRAFVEPASMSAMRDIQTQMEAVRHIVPQIAVADVASVLAQYEIVRSVSAVQNIRSVAEEAALAIDAYRNIGLPAVESFSEQIRIASSSVAAAETFTTTFAGQLFERMRRVAVAQDDDEAETSTQELATFVTEGIARARSGPVSTEGFIQIILAVVFFLYQWAESQKLETRLNSRFDAIESRLKASASTQPAQPSVELRVVAIPRLRVRNSPHVKAAVRTVLSGNVLVRIVSQQGGWSRVEYFDFTTGNNAEGWVASRYLQSIPLR